MTYTVPQPLLDKLEQVEKLRGARAYFAGDAKIKPYLDHPLEEETEGWLHRNCGIDSDRPVHPKTSYYSCNVEEADKYARECFDRLRGNITATAKYAARTDAERKRLTALTEQQDIYKAQLDGMQQNYYRLRRNTFSGIFAAGAIGVSAAIGFVFVVGPAAIAGAVIAGLAGSGLALNEKIQTNRLNTKMDAIGKTRYAELLSFVKKDAPFLKFIQDHAQVKKAAAIWDQQIATLDAEIDQELGRPPGPVRLSRAEPILMRLPSASPVAQQVEPA